MSPDLDMASTMLERAMQGQPLVVVILVIAVFVLWRDSVSQRAAITTLATEITKAVEGMKSAVDRLTDEIRSKKD